MEKSEVIAKYGSIPSACGVAFVTDGKCNIGMDGISDYGGASVCDRGIPCKKDT